MWPTRGLPARRAPVALATLALLQIVSFVCVPQDDLALVVRPGDTVRDGAAAVRGAAASLFAHADAPHLAANVVGAFLVGGWVEAMHGHARLLVLYLASGVGGALGFRAWRCVASAERASLVGASSAVYGLLGAAAAHLLLNWAELPYARVWLAACVLALVLEVGAYVVAPAERVAYSAHVAGAVWGLCVGTLVLRNVRLVRHERLYGAAAAIACVLLGVGVLTACS